MRLMTRKPDSFLIRLERKLDRLGYVVSGEWVWPIVMATLGTGAILAALLVYPGAGEQMMFLGFRFSSQLAFLAEPPSNYGNARNAAEGQRIHIRRAKTLERQTATLLGEIR